MGWSGLATFLLFANIVILRITCQHDYGDALSKCILFYEGQRSGELPSTQRMKWRKNSALQDGRQSGVDLVGGYYDAGDNVKYNFPMAFTTTVLAWSVLEFGEFMDLELQHANEAIRWATDYLLKSTNIEGTVFVQVGDPNADHNCWERPEDMDTPRTVYSVTRQRPGSEVAAETAAALAASSIVFMSSDPSYSKKLLNRAMKVFDFADKYRGSYNDSLGRWVCPFYCDWSGYEDELLWAASWLYKASNNTNYLKYLVDNITQMGSKHINSQKLRGPTSAEFGWDNKDAGINVLIASSIPGLNNELLLAAANTNAKNFVCQTLPESPTRGVNYTPGGLLYKPIGGNIQNPTTLSFLLLVYATQLKRTNNVVECGNITANSNRLISLAKSQVDYLLGNNPMKMSFMVGYGKKFPRRIHHRGSSMPSMDDHPGHIACKGGTPFFLSKYPNPNMLTGAMVGPFENDTYPDTRLSPHAEPTTYVNAPFVGVLAFFKGHSN